jgi:hypothetical protein
VFHLLFLFQLYSHRLAFSYGKLLLTQMLSGCFIGTLMYYGIVRQGGKPSAQGYLVGYGICIPLSVWISYQIVELLDIRSVALRLTLCSTPMTMLLRCLQAMHGVVPIASQESLWEYILSVAFILRPRYDKNGQTLPSTARLVGGSIRKYMSWLLVLALLYPLLAPFDFYPFASTVDAQEVMFTFDFPNLYNSYIQLGKSSI